MIVEAHGVIRGREADRAGDEIFRRSGGKFFFSRSAFGDGDVAGGFDELFELFVGDFGGVHPEWVDVNAMDGEGVASRPRKSAKGIGLSGSAHGEFAAGNPDHAFGGGSWGLVGVGDGDAKGVAGFSGRIG